MAARDPLLSFDPAGSGRSNDSGKATLLTASSSDGIAGKMDSKASEIFTVRACVYECTSPSM